MKFGSQQFIQCLPFRYGFICVVASDGFVRRVIFSEQRQAEERFNDLTGECINQIRQYLAGRRRGFDCPIRLEGTEFQKLVWRETMKIPYGQVITYKELARRTGRPSAYRAVARALGANRLPLIIPCHRIVAADGLGGFTPGVEIKKFLLSIEGVTI